MNVMHTLVLRQMKSQKRRTIITVLGVIVAVAMIAAVSSFAATFADLFQRVEIESSGEWHAKITNTTAADRALIAKDARVRDVFVVGSHGAMTPPEKAGRYAQAEVFSLDAAGRDVMRAGLLSGAYPEKEGEIALTKAFVQAAGLQAGDSLSLTDDLGKTQEFTVSGVVSLSALEGYGAGVTAALVFQSEETAGAEGATAVIRLKKPDKGVYDWLQALCESIPGEQQYSTHTSLLMYMGVSSNDAVMMSIYLMEGIIMAIILAAAVSLIYNAFAISVTDRAAQFGMLSSIGATMRQRRRAVLFEALSIALIAIPFGLFFGYLGMGVTFSVVSDLMRGAFTGNAGSQADLRLVVNGGAVLLSISLALVTVLVSAWIPAKRAARVSPMEAIRKTQDIKLSGKKVKTSALTRALFGFEGELAAKNLKRNRKRYRVTTFSLAMSLILFLSAYSFTHYMTYSYTMATDTMDYNLELSAYLFQGKADGQVSYETLDALEREALAAPHVEQAVAYTQYHTGLNASLPRESFDRYAYTEQLKRAMGGGPFDVSVMVLSLDDESLRAYAEKTGADFAALQDASAPAAILINSGNLYKNDRFNEITMLDIAPGDTLEVQGMDPAFPGPRILPFRLAAVTGEYPLGLPDTLLSPMVTLVLSEATARALLPQVLPYLHVLYLTATPDLAEEALTQVRDTYSILNRAMTQEEADALAEKGAYLSVNLSNYDALMLASQRLIAIINIFVYGFIILLSLVGAANIVGTISTSLLLRKREFAMVKSVGMGPRAFDRMIRCESVFYGVKAVLWGLAGSAVVLVLMWLSVGQSFSVPFQLPWLQMLIGVAGIFLLVAATMAYSVHKIRKDTIVEDLRLE